MTIELTWLLIGAPLAFLMGWVASRLDLRQWRRAGRDAPRAYFEGLNLLLNEQQDKAIDAFIEAVQLDPDTTELHFALGNLFRRRGEVERAVRVHRHLLSRADLKPADRDRAQLALAQDFMKAGLFDHAEQAWSALAGTGFDLDAQRALLSLHERSHDWSRALEVAQRLQDAGDGSFASRMAHYHCERALEAEAAGQIDLTWEALEQARRADPGSPHAHQVAGEIALRQQRPAEALSAWRELLVYSPAHFAMVAQRYARTARELGQDAAARTVLEHAYAADAGPDLVKALIELDTDQASPQRWLAHLKRQPTLTSAAAVLDLPPQSWQADTPGLLQSTVQRAAHPLQRYRCAACGFEAHHYFWQCPGCQGWDTYPPRHLEAG